MRQQVASSSGPSANVTGRVTSVATLDSQYGPALHHMDEPWQGVGFCKLRDQHDQFGDQVNIEVKLDQHERQPKAGSNPVPLPGHRSQQRGRSVHQAE
jgi:hypothetical protein